VRKELEKPQEKEGEKEKELLVRKKAEVCVRPWHWDGRYAWHSQSLGE
jgi:hypothetical protein